MPKGVKRMDKIPSWAYLLFICIVFISLVLTVSISIGVFKKVEIIEGNWSDIYAIYTEHTGEYHKISRSISEVEDWAIANSIDCAITFGEYLDNPKEVETDNLRSNAGCLLETLPDIDMPFKTKNFPNSRALTVDFEGSPAVGPLKVYPKINKFIEYNDMEFLENPIEVYTKIAEGKYSIKYVFFINSKEK